MVSSSSITSMLPCTSKWLLACLLSFWRLHRNSIILVELYDFRRVHFWPPKLEAQLWSQPKNRIMEFYNSWSFPKSNPHYSLFLRENGVARNLDYYCIDIKEKTVFSILFHLKQDSMRSKHSVWKSKKKYHPTLKIWIFGPNSVTRHCVNRTKMGGKCQN